MTLSVSTTTAVLAAATHINNSYMDLCVTNISLFHIVYENV